MWLLSMLSLSTHLWTTDISRFSIHRYYLRHGGGRNRARSRGQGASTMASKALDVASMSLEVVKGNQKGGYRS